MSDDDLNTPDHIIAAICCHTSLFFTFVCVPSYAAYQCNTRLKSRWHHPLHNPWSIGATGFFIFEIVTRFRSRFYAWRAHRFLPVCETPNQWLQTLFATTSIRGNGTVDFGNDLTYMSLDTERRINNL